VLLRTMKPLPFEKLHDAEGSVTLGWAGDSVVHACVAGGLSAALGARLASEVQTLVGGFSGVHYFCDAAKLTRYDLLARSAFVRMALANRRCFASFALLTWPVAVSPAANAFTAALGDSVTLFHDASDFERRLLELAPLARHRIEPVNAARFESAARPFR
jgi:hypothetical protein